MRGLGDQASKLGPNLEGDGALVLCSHFKKMILLGYSGGRDIREESITIIQQERVGNES